MRVVPQPKQNRRHSTLDNWLVFAHVENGGRVATVRNLGVPHDRRFLVDGLKAKRAVHESYAQPRFDEAQAMSIPEAGWCGRDDGVLFATGRGPGREAPGGRAAKNCRQGENVVLGPIPPCRLAR